MGQYWVFLNIDKRQRLDTMGGIKMGEFFFSDYPPDVIKYLAVPEGQTVNEHRKHDPDSWTGDRIICVGDYTQDWPPNILGADDCTNLESPHFLYNHAFSVRKSRRDPPEYSGSGVLRNLSKKIYVHSSGLPIVSSKSNKLCMTKWPGPPIDYDPGLGTVLLSRVGWSEDPSNAMCWDKADSLTEGEWAGDRFDVRAFDDVKEELEADGWVDATKEEAKRITSIWKSENE